MKGFVAPEGKSWQEGWDGESEAHLANLAVRAFAAAASHGRYAVDDAPRHQDGIVDLWIDYSRGAVRGDKLSLLGEEGYTKGRISVWEDDNLVRFRLRTDLICLGRLNLLELTDEQIGRDARECVLAMDELIHRWVSDSAHPTPGPIVGGTLWYHNRDRRLYDSESQAKRERHKWVEAEIVGETRQSWLVSGPGLGREAKVSKKDLTHKTSYGTIKFLTSRLEMEDALYVRLNAYKIAERVQRLGEDEADKLRQIARIVGYEPED